MNILFALIMLTIGSISIATGVHLVGWPLLILSTSSIIYQIYEALPFTKKKKKWILNEISTMIDDLDFLCQVRKNPSIDSLRKIYYDKRLKKLFSDVEVGQHPFIQSILEDIYVVKDIKALIEEARNSYEWKILDDLENRNEN